MSTYRYRENRCEHGFVNQGIGLCPECDPSTQCIKTAPKEGTKAHKVTASLLAIAPTNLKGLVAHTGMPLKDVEQVLRRLVVGGVVERGGNSVKITPHGKVLLGLTSSSKP